MVLDPQKSSSKIEMRVRFCETDMMGIVHHANYLVYFEAARVEWMRRRGATHAMWSSQGIHLPVVDASLRYRAPARFDDALVVETQLTEVRAASLRYDYKLWRDGTLLAEGTTRLACVNDDHAVRRIPAEVVAVLSSPEIEAVLV
jgi:acyl-CoA thioester hydrolase